MRDQAGDGLAQRLGNRPQIEIEERYRFAEKWTASVFLGVACTYGGGKSCSDSENLYPAGGGGVQYALKPKEGIVLNPNSRQAKIRTMGSL